MTCFNFTKAALETVTIRPKQYQVRDSKTPGLFLRVNPTGSKTFMLYRKIESRTVRIKIGRFPQMTIESARKQMAILNSQIMKGDYFCKPKQESLQSITFKELFYRYYNEYAVLHTKRPKDNEAHVKYHLLYRIGSLKTGEISKDIMKKIHLSIAESSGKCQANRILNLTSAIFNYGINEDIIQGKNPCVGIKRFKIRSRDRFLNKEELQLFFAALSEEEQIYQDFFMLTLFIGARKSTMLQMQYAELDFDLKRWRLSEDQSKNDDVNIYMLSDVALEILQRRLDENNKLDTPSPYVFPGIGSQGHLVDPKKSFARIKKRMGVLDIRIHDLRRTLGSYMAIGNCSLPIIGQALNHKSQDSTAIYARLSKDPVLEAVNAAARLMGSSKTENTIPIVIAPAYAIMNVQTKFEEWQLPK